MIKNNKPTVVKEFVESAYVDIKNRHSEEAGIKDVLMFLAEKSLIEPRRLRDYMIIKDYADFLKKNDGKICVTMIDLGIKYDISERTVQNILYKTRSNFYTKTNIRKNL